MNDKFYFQFLVEGINEGLAESLFEGITELVEDIDGVIGGNFYTEVEWQQKKDVEDAKALLGDVDRAEEFLDLLSY